MLRERDRYTGGRVMAREGGNSGRTPRSLHPPHSDGSSWAGERGEHSK